MIEYTKTLNSLVTALHRLPGIGHKMAERLALHILKTPAEDVQFLAQSLLHVKSRIGYCSLCGSITETDLCALCSDNRRAKNIMCIVEQPQDVWAIERSHEYRGQYHVLMGAIAPLDGIGPDQLRIRELLERLKTGSVQEIIIATNLTVEGEATAMYLAKILKSLHMDSENKDACASAGLRVSRIAHGVPVGSDLEYTDVVTIAKAIEGRKVL